MKFLPSPLHEGGEKHVRRERAEKLFCVGRRGRRREEGRLVLRRRRFKNFSPPSPYLPSHTQKRGGGERSMTRKSKVFFLRRRRRSEEEEEEEAAGDACVHGFPPPSKTTRKKRKLLRSLSALRTIYNSEQPSFLISKRDYLAFAAEHGPKIEFRRPRHRLSHGARESSGIFFNKK